MVRSVSLRGLNAEKLVLGHGRTEIPNPPNFQVREGEAARRLLEEARVEIAEMHTEMLVSQAVHQLIQTEPDGASHEYQAEHRHGFGEEAQLERDIAVWEQTVESLQHELLVQREAEMKEEDESRRLESGRQRGSRFLFLFFAPSESDYVGLVCTASNIFV